MNQRVLITARASGIGLEVARAFAAQGSKEFVCDIDAKALEDLKQEILGVVTKVCNVSKRKDVEQMIAFGVDALGGLDVLVNNAGFAGPTVPVEEFNPDDWEKVVQINLNGTFNVTRLAIPHLKKSPAGVIINMASVAGRFGYANRSAYSATKWAIVGFTKTLSIELGEFNIRANAILPGAVDGERIQKVFEGRSEAEGKPLEEIKKEAMAAQSIKRLVDPRDIAALAVFLASDAGKSISGQMLPIDNDMQKAS